MVIKLYVHPSTGDREGLLAIIQQVSAIIGCRFSVKARIEEADVLYAPPEIKPPQGIKLQIPFQSGAFDPRCPLENRKLDEESLLLLRDSSDPIPDYFGLIRRFLTFVDEANVDENLRNQLGVFPTSALPHYRRQSAMVPVVERLCLHLKFHLVSRGLLKDPKGKWPRGKKYAIVLTHDTDAAHMGAIPELATYLTKGILRRDVNFFKTFLTGLKYIGRPHSNPYFAFEDWRDLEHQVGAKSAFFLFYRPQSVPLHFNDCKSTASSAPFDWKVMHRLADQGWEFGFHAPIHCRRGLDGFIDGKLWLENKLKRPVHGLRHHYWSINWRKPHLTFRKMVNAGFRYDCSIAWQSEAGFRAGTCHPFLVFDPQRQKTLQLIEIPSCLMDGHIMGLADAVQQGRSIVNQVKDVGGVAVLDWHTETAINRFHYKGFIDGWQGVLEPFFGDSECWLATPWEVAQHWHTQLLAAKPEVA